MTATPPMYCRICQQPLDTAGDYDEDGMMVHVRHKHPPWYEADHEPDPALIEERTEVLAHCDFCLADVRDGGWTYPAKDFLVMVEIAPGHITDFGSSEDWCACDACHRDIENGWWADMVKRSKTWQEAPAAQKPIAEQFMRNLWIGFENNRTGPAYHEQRRRPT
jgi:hypothetical protein